jgi:DNA-binding transcriptional LysR family regulator
VRAVERGRRAARAALALEAGELEIATVLSMAVGLLPRYIRLWHERYPDVGIRLQEFRHRSLLEEAVEQGIADFAIGPLPLRAWEGPLEQVSWEEFVVVAPPADPLASRKSVRLEELADREWVLYHPDHGLAGVLEEVCRRAGFSPRGTVRTSQAEGAARLASAGIGPALVPDNIVLPGIEGSVLRLVPPLIREVAVYSRMELSRTAAAFVDVLRSEQRPRPRGAVTIHL